MTSVMQKLFNKAYRGMANQGFEQSKSVNSHGINTCRYRGENGKKCAVGHIIPDELYMSEMEGNAVAGLCSIYPELQFNDENLINLLAELQSAHDFEMLPDERRKQFIKIAREYGLEVPEE